MNDAVFTNAALLQYWNLTRGDSKTRLTLSDIMCMGVVVKCVDMIPVSGSGVNAIYLNDGYVDLQTNGVTYTSFPDFISDSFPTFSEKKDISNDAVTFKISNIDPSMQTLALGGALKNARVNIYLAIISPADNTVIALDLMFSGYIDYFTSTANNQSDSLANELEISLNSIWKKIDVQMKTVAANSVHQSTHPGDEYFSLLGIVHAEQTWKYK